MDQFRKTQGKNHKWIGVGGATCYCCRPDRKGMKASRRYARRQLKAQLRSDVRQEVL
jgi:hypothetical protein